MAYSCEAILNSGECLEVLFNQSAICVFDRQIKAIGAYNTLGSAIVIIVSNRAALVTHIAPLRKFSNSNNNIDIIDHVRENMKDLVSLYNDFKSRCFPPCEETYCLVLWPGLVVSETGSQLTALFPSKMATVGEELKAVELGPNFHLYSYTEGNNKQSSPSRGTVLVDGRGRDVTVYLNDRVTHVIKNRHTAADSLTE